MVRALGVLLLVVLACKPSPGPDPEPPSAAAPSPPPAPPPSPPAPAPAGPELQAGGRTLSWWGQRLTTLRKEGPPELYELTLQRARANGLRVSVTDAAITVQAAEGAGVKP